MLTDTRYGDLGSDHIGGYLKSDITGKKNSDSSTVLRSTQAQILVDTSDLGRSNVLPIEVIAANQRRTVLNREKRTECRE